MSIRLGQWVRERAVAHFSTSLFASRGFSFACAALYVAAFVKFLVIGVRVEPTLAGLFSDTMVTVGKGIPSLTAAPTQLWEWRRGGRPPGDHSLGALLEF